MNTNAFPKKEVVYQRNSMRAMTEEVVDQFSKARVAAMAELSATSLLQIAMAHLREAYDRHMVRDDIHETNHIVREGIGAALLACDVSRITVSGDEPPLVLQRTAPERVEAVYARALEFVNEIVDDNQVDSLEEIGAFAYLELAISRLRWVANQMTSDAKYTPVEHLLLAMNGIAATVVRYEEGRL